MNYFKGIITLMIILIMTGCGNASSDSESKAQQGKETESAAKSEQAKEKESTPAVSAETVKSQEPEAQKTEPPKAENQQETIKWVNYNEGLETAKNQKKKVFLTFYAEWCKYCKVMESNTFTDKSVISYLNEHYVAIRVNSDKDTNTASKYQVRGIPVSWFISENGENIGSQPGYIPPEKMVPLLKYISTDSYKTMQFSEFVQKM